MQIWCIDAEVSRAFAERLNSNTFNSLSVLFHIPVFHILSAERESNNTVYPLE